jgi:hypothetical protein
MPTVAYDLHYLQAGLDQLESYLLSNDIYRPIGLQAAHGQPPYPQLTLGWLLLARLRAQATTQASPSTSTERLDLDRLNQQLYSLRGRWRSAWGLKAGAEFRARLSLWRDFLEEYRAEPASNLDRYPYEVSRRVLLELLSQEASSLPEASLQALAGLDAWLRAVLLPAGFVWEPVLALSFPQSTYWYLYGALPVLNERVP